LLSRMSSLGTGLALLLAAAATPLLPASAVAQGEVKSTHGDWQMRCDTPPGAASEQCALIQNVTAEDRENVGLSVIVLKTADKQARILRVLAPLGVLLPSGLGLRVDDADIGRAGFVRCLPNGCIAEVILDDTLIDKLKTGSQATFIIFQTPEEGIGIPISLNGFSAGFAALP
jgi:invasion protein IalB